MILSKKYQDRYETWCFVMSASFSEISTGHSYDMICRENAYGSLQQCCFKQLCRSFSCYRDSPLGSLLICITRVNIPRTSNTPVSMQSGEKETHSSDKRGDQMSPSYLNIHQVHRRLMPLLFTEFPASREMRNGRLALGRRWNMRLASGSCSYQVSRCYFLRVCVASKPLSFLPVAASGSNIVYFAYRPLLHFCPLRHTARIQLKSNAVSSLHWMKSLKFYQNIQTS